MNELDTTMEAYIITTQSSLELLSTVTEENPLILQEDLKKYSKKATTNKRLSALEVWMDEVLEAERIAEEKKQAKKDKKNK